MLSVTFKYVGQGDCIIVEWNAQDRPGIGIIDCNKVDGGNVLVEYLEATRPRVIDFLFLSHPHRDHYSGLLDVLLWCEEEKTSINLFGHTARNLNEYVKGIVILSAQEKEALPALFRKVKDLCQMGVIQRRGLITDMMVPLLLTGGLSLRFVAPSEDEYDAFLKSLHHPDLSNKANPNPNYLSTVAIIESEDWYLLLTSDAERDVLKRITHGPLHRDSKRCVLGQVPHHGAEKNHYRLFWQQRNRANDSIAAISVGPNHYGHPSNNVITGLQKMRYNVQQTWYASNAGAEIEKIGRALNLVNFTAPPVNIALRHSGDLVYQISIAGKIDEV
ncbi:ComEC/Rec2 family competence protein [Rhodocaloribacter sp.]